MKHHHTWWTVFYGWRDLVFFENFAFVAGVSWWAFDDSTSGWHDAFNTSDSLVISGPVEDQTLEDDLSLAVRANLEIK